MSISFSSPVTRDGRLRGAGVTAVLGPILTEVFGKRIIAAQQPSGLATMAAPGETEAAPAPVSGA